MEDVRQQAEQESQLLGQDGENETVTEDATFMRGEPSQNANGPPKVDSKAEILHEKVTKQITKEGHGPIPSKYSTCFLHYRAWTESTGHKFEDTWDEQQPLEMILGKWKKEKNWLGCWGVQHEVWRVCPITCRRGVGVWERRELFFSECSTIGRYII
ncbi:peptidyl-prolyl cis-trans isomerase FKBP42-like [Malus sylvestris]|uniref:peptidyl-prolyl cis-trans isomerase FKBP42-like n=1 Tax=Malus sylvestris TaxID=3752 RepID=UPI0021AC813A|nr:peptidyl-prolyl cis-trans isomerase FKBP42-like [Malus sylvestris]XP_050153944.1 peptidyl-prolyl cis-trans isomerase FKBP42-like [Malus sylvestris]XP_050153945.1 peptidyl-prolyl cis-trans isomerase FKBP42-like [Malus sylvestris]